MASSGGTGAGFFILSRRSLAALTIATAGILSACATQVPPPPAAEGSAVVSSEFIYENAPFPQAHASTIVETKPGELLAAWFGGKRESDPRVGIWMSRQVHGKWEEPREVANGRQPDGTTFATWNPVLFKPRGGKTYLFYKVGTAPETWWGMVKISGDDGKSWSEAKRLPDGILGPIKNKPVVLADGSWLAPASIETETEWLLVFYRSKDKGKSWRTTGPIPSEFNVIQPSILFHRGGKLEAVARTRQGVVAMTWSSDNGKSWTRPAATNLPNPNSGTDAITLADGRHLIVYNHSASRARYPLNVGLSDDGVTWRNVLTLEDEPIKEGYAYPSVIQTSDDMVHVTYTFDRVRIKHVVIDPRRLEIPSGPRR